MESAQKTALGQRDQGRFVSSSISISNTEAGDGTRTRDLQLGKLTLYQLSYSRNTKAPYTWNHQRATEGD